MLLDVSAVGQAGRKERRERRWFVAGGFRRRSFLRDRGALPRAVFLEVRSASRVHLRCRHERSPDGRRILRVPHLLLPRPAKPVLDVAEVFFLPRRD